MAYYLKRSTLVLGFVALILVIIEMLPAILPYSAMPKNRIYTGMHGYSDDYIGYVSYIKEGMYGRNTIAIRSLPPPQPALPVHFVYVWFGKVAALTGINAPFMYHAARFILGIIFVFLTFELMQFLFGSFFIALSATILSFISGPIGLYLYERGSWVFKKISFFDFAVNVSERLVLRPHYTLGVCLFLLELLIVLKKNKVRERYFLLSGFILAIALALIHPVMGLILFLTVLFFIPFEAGWVTWGILTGASAGLLISYWSTHQYPVVSILAFEGYVAGGSLALTSICNEIVSFGPTFWVGGLMLLLSPFIFKKNSRGTFLLIIWFIIQDLLFFEFYPFFRAERTRFLQPVFYIPMAYGTGLFLQSLYKRRKSLGYLFILSFLMVSLVPFLRDLKDNINLMTDYKNFSLFIFPSIKQNEAFRFLDTETPVESTILASWEASNLILIYSHNYVLGNTQGWSGRAKDEMLADKDRFYEGNLANQQAYNYLKKNHISYIYDGYQEMALGDIGHYSFLNKVFQNSEVTIYRVQNYTKM